jgi:hypothetical protein
MVRVPSLTTAVTDVERALAAALLGQPAPPVSPQAFVEGALHHQLAPLLVRAGLVQLPEHATEPLRRTTREHAVIAALRDRELARVIDRLHHDGVRCLVVKGAHVAHACYPCSYLRVRADADLVIRPADRDAAIATLRALGYRRQQAVQTGADVLGQILFAHDDHPGSAIDLHWRLSAPRAAAALFDTDALVERAVPIPALGPHARGPSIGDALAIACVHQVAHHRGDDRLLWMYDVHLLLQALDDLDADLFVHRAAERGMAQICRRVIDGAAARFPSGRAVEISEKLQAAAAVEPAAVLLEARAPIAGLIDDVVAERRWRERIRLVAGHLFPPPAYMRETWAPGSRIPLPVLYASRLLRAAPRWLRVRTGSAAAAGRRED